MVFQPDWLRRCGYNEQPETMETALLPKSLIGDGEVQSGDEIVLKVVRVYGDEVEVEYYKKESEDEEMSAGDEIDAIARSNSAPMPGMIGGY